MSYRITFDTYYTVSYLDEVYFFENSSYSSVYAIISFSPIIHRCEAREPMPEQVISDQYPTSTASRGLPFSTLPRQSVITMVWQDEIELNAYSQIPTVDLIHASIQGADPSYPHFLPLHRSSVHASFLLLVKLSFWFFKRQGCRDFQWIRFDN